jgi:hypothetical protein
VSGRKPRFEGETRIVIQGRRAEDIVWIVIGTTFLALTIWVTSEALSGRAPDGDGFALFMILAAPVAIWALVEPVSRLKDRRPFFQADAEGLRLHPGFWPRPLPWSDVRTLSIQTDPFGGAGLGAQNGQIRILLREPGRAAAYPFGTREIRMDLRRLGLSRKDAADLLRRLRVLRNPLEGAELIS